jgi:hypothetical protein
MSFWIAMTGNTLRGYLFEPATSMTAFTTGIDVGTGKGEYLGVTFDAEAGQGVAAVVTSQAVRAVGLDMDSHKFGLGLSMTIGTCGYQQSEFTPSLVTSCTLEGSALVIQAVSYQAELGCLVIKVCQGSGPQIETAARVFQVAKGAFINQLKTAVYPADSPALLSHALMASLTTLGLNPLEGGVALTASVAKLGVRQKAAQLDAVAADG